MKKSMGLFLVAAVMIVFTACGPEEKEPPAALRITGAVDQEQDWTEAEVKRMKTVDAQRENNAGEISTYTGVPVNALLEDAGLVPDASKIVLVADDGQKVDISLEKIKSCPDCILSFRNQGGFSAVFPEFPGKVQVKGVVEIRVERVE